MEPTGHAIDVVLKSQPSGYRNAVNNYGQFYIIAVRTGELRFESRNVDARLTAGGHVVLRAESDFVLSSDDGYTGIAVELRPPDDSRYHGDSFVLLPTGRVPLIVDWVHALLSAPGPGSASLTEALGRTIVEHALFSHGRSVPAEPAEAIRRSWASRVDEALKNAVYTNLTVDEILAGFEPSYRQLSRYVSLEFGASPKRRHVEHKMSAARRLLVETRWSATTIALELGFSSTQHFTTRFRNWHGLPPNQWRLNGADVRLKNTSREPAGNTEQT
jgi:AraC-like DNA-binding protein